MSNFDLGDVVVAAQEYSLSALPAMRTPYGDFIPRGARGVVVERGAWRDQFLVAFDDAPGVREWLPAKLLVPTGESRA